MFTQINFARFQQKNCLSKENITDFPHSSAGHRGQLNQLIEICDRMKIDSVTVNEGEQVPCQKSICSTPRWVGQERDQMPYR